VTTRAHGGCLFFGVYRSGEGPWEIALLEEWASPEALEEHVRSADFRVVLSAMDASTREPIFRVDRIESSGGFERVAGILRAGTG
jgi:quinol monooxygenase YgiN